MEYSETFHHCVLLTLSIQPWVCMRAISASVAWRDSNQVTFGSEKSPASFMPRKPSSTPIARLL
jgi:hypothetical protein